MIIVALDTDQTDHWGKDELWLDWLSGYLCRQAVFSKGSHHCLSIVACERIGELILMVPTNVDPQALSNAIGLGAQRTIYCSERSKRFLKNAFNELFNEVEIFPLEKFLTDITSGELLPMIQA